MPNTKQILVPLASVALALTLVPAASAPANAANAEDARTVPVRLKVATQPAVAVTTTPRVWPTELLEANGVPVDGNDLVIVSRDGDRVTGAAKRVRHGDTVRLVTVEKTRTTKERTLEAEVVEVPTTKLKPGRRTVVREGRDGVEQVTIVRTLHNDELVAKRVAKRTTLTEARTRRVLVGREPWSVPGTDGLNWGALAGCESGGNPRAVNPAGYYGLYQFNTGTWQSVGGSGLPSQASAAEQTYRAKLLYKSRGRSPWPNCGRLL